MIKILPLTLDEAFTLSHPRLWNGETIRCLNEAHFNILALFLRHKSDQTFYFLILAFPVTPRGRVHAEEDTCAAAACTFIDENFTRTFLTIYVSMQQEQRTLAIFYFNFIY